MENNKITGLKEHYSNLVQESFDTFIFEIMDLNDMDYFDVEQSNNMTDDTFKIARKRNEQLKEFCNNISLSFNSNMQVAGNAQYATSQILVSANNQLKVNHLIIHEFSHLAVYHFSGGSIIGHTLEFAIFNYCLDYRYSYGNNMFLYKTYDEAKKNVNETFFRSYDIHEDISYPNLLISPCRFDSWIKTIEFANLEDLYNQAVKLAKRIRKKTLV